MKGFSTLLVRSREWSRSNEAKDADWGKHKAKGIDNKTGTQWPKVKTWFGYIRCTLYPELLLAGSHIWLFVKDVAIVSYGTRQCRKVWSNCQDKITEEDLRILTLILFSVQKLGTK